MPLDVPNNESPRPSEQEERGRQEAKPQASIRISLDQLALTEERGLSPFRTGVVPVSDPSPFRDLGPVPDSSTPLRDLYGTLKL